MSGRPSVQPCIVLAGMHRSGTSLAASLLHGGGLYLGKELLGANDGNREGYHEDVEFVRFHEDALRALGLSKEGWIDQPQVEVREPLLARAAALVEARRALGCAWGWKDPRTVLFLDFWRARIPEAKFVFVVRSPWEVLDSLFRRANPGDEAFALNPVLAVDVYTGYNRAILRFLDAYPADALAITVEQILESPGALADGIGRRFGVTLAPPDPSLVRPGGVRRTEDTFRPSLLKRFFPDAVDVYERLLGKSGGTMPHAARKADGETFGKWVLQDWVGARRAEYELQLARTTIGMLEKDKARLLSEIEEKCREMDRAVVELHECNVKLYEAARARKIVEDSFFWKARNAFLRVLKVLRLQAPPDNPI